MAPDYFVTNALAKLKDAGLDKLPPEDQWQYERFVGEGVAGRLK